MIYGGSKEDEEDACSIKSVAESKALLNKWTGQVIDSKFLDRSSMVVL